MIRKKQKIQDNDSSQDDSFEIRLSVKIGGRLIESDLDKALFIPTVDKLNPTMISNMMAENPSLHARWNFLFNEAAYDYDMKKIKLEVWIAKKSQEYRKLLAQVEKGRVTDKMVDESIKVDPEYTKVNDDLATSKKNMKHILAQANGFGEKGDKVTSIASMMKWEGENLSGGGKVSGKDYKHIKKDKDYNFDKESNDGWPSK